MLEFAYHRPSTPETAVNDAASGGMFIAGGTEVLNWLRLGVTAPADVIDVTRIGELHGIRVDADSIVIGAATRLSEIAAHRDVLSKAPALAEACGKVGSPQIRNRATIAGNLLQKTRCLYFRAEAADNQQMPWKCNKRVAGSGCAALDGSDDYGALFGGTDTCVASHPSDLAVALAVLDAEVLIIGPDHDRAIPITEFHLTPQDAVNEGHEPMTTETRLAERELVTGIRIPLSAAAENSRFLKVQRRQAFEHSLLSTAVAIDEIDGVAQTLAIALGSVALKPVRLLKTEATLKGKSLSRSVVETALEDELQGANPLPGHEYKTKLAANAVVRAIFGSEA